VLSPVSPSIFNKESVSQLLSDVSNSNLEWVRNLTEKIASKQKYKPIKKRVKIEMPRNDKAESKASLHT
jgi:hypothetical protein